jgi:hypothetical protein
VSAEDRQRYLQAMHGVQTGIAFEQTVGVGNVDSHKHLRVGIDSAHISQGALAELLIEKGLITLDELEAKLAHFAERELMSYESKYPGVHFR